MKQYKEIGVIHFALCCPDEMLTQPSFFCNLLQLPSIIASINLIKDSSMLINFLEQFAIMEGWRLNEDENSIV